MVKKAIKIGRRSKANVNSAVAPERQNKKNGGAKAPPFWFVEGFAWISAAAAERSAATGWRATAPMSRSTGGSTAPGCWPLPRWCRPASSADEPVCSTLIRFLLKSWRICTIDRLAPKADACDRSVTLAVLSDVRTLLVEALSMKSVPAVSAARPRPAGLKVTPVDRRRRLAGFVEHQFQRVAVQQVDAVEGRILRRGRDLRDDLVVLSDQTTQRVACDTASATAAVTRQVAVPTRPPRSRNRPAERRRHRRGDRGRSVIVVRGEGTELLALSRLAVR